MFKFCIDVTRRKDYTLKRKSLQIKVNRAYVTVFFSLLFLFLLLCSEMMFFLGTTKAAFIMGMQKTYLFIGILVCGIVAATKQHPHLDAVISVFIFFTIFTCISTIFGVKPDIIIWRQCVHLSFFASVLIIFYKGNCCDHRAYLNMIYAIFVVLLCIYIWSAANVKSKSGNTVYYVLMFLPFVSLLKGKFIRNLFYIALVSLVLLSNKRTALLAVIAYFLMFEYITNKRIDEKLKIYKGIGYIIIVVIAYFVYPIILNKFGITVFDEISNMSADGGSNRLLIYGQLWKAQLNGGVKHWLIGEGYNSVLLSKICTDGIGGAWVSGHNDFFEVLYDYGIIGFFLYLSFLIGLIRKGIKMVGDSYSKAAPFLGSIAFVLVMSMTSHMIIYLNYYAVIMIFWAMCIAEYEYIRAYRLR